MDDAPPAPLEPLAAAGPGHDDPAADLTAMAAAYRAHALAHPHLYAVMFGATTLGGYRLRSLR